MRIGITGSRQGADLADVTAFLTALYRKYPEAVIVSGGARGVDQTAEQEWLRLGGRVISLRPKEIGTGEFVIERWMLDGGLAGVGAGGPLAYGPTPASSPKSRIDVLAHPTWATYASACIYRDLLISEMSDRLVSFQRKGGSNGAQITCGFAAQKGVPVNRYTTEERFAA